MNKTLAKKTFRSVAINGAILGLLAMAVFPSTKVLSEDAKVLIIGLTWAGVFVSVAMLFVFRERRK